MGSHLFNDQAQSYALYRPDYPSKLYEEIYSYLGSDRPYNVVIDQATGSGQAAVALAEKFEQVLAYDPSATQIAAAVQKPNITYKLGSAEKIEVADSSADLITVASALHWFEVEKFFKEAERVLRPGGVVAIWGYHWPEIEGWEQANVQLHQLIDSLMPYWDGRIQLVFDKNGPYASVKIDQKWFQEEKRVRVPFHATWPLKHFVGYVSTWSAHATLKREHPDREDPLIAFKQSLLETPGVSDETPVKIRFDNILILAKART